MDMVLRNICISSRICLHKEVLSMPVIVGYDCPNSEDCKCQQFVKAPQPVNFRKVNRTLLQSNVLCRLHNSNLYYSLLSFPLPYSFSKHPVWIKGSSFQWNAATPWMEEVSSGPVALQDTTTSSSQNLPLDTSQWKHAHSEVASGPRRRSKD